MYHRTTKQVLNTYNILLSQLMNLYSVMPNWDISQILQGSTFTYVIYEILWIVKQQYSETTTFK